MLAPILATIEQPAIIIDWSDLCADRSWQLLRAALMVKGRSLTVYEEVHSIKMATKPAVHEQFMLNLKMLLPQHCRPVFVTDAGFRAPWFKLLDSMGYAWIGRIRNRDMVTPNAAIPQWEGCKKLYERATSKAQDLGQYLYVRGKAMACRLVLIKKNPQGRHCKNVDGKVSKSGHSLKQARAQNEPWLLAVSPQLAEISADMVVRLYSGRMQIEQTFRDSKNVSRGLGLTQSQTRSAERLSMLLLIGALLTYALWLIGLAVKSLGYRIEYGGKKKAAKALSLLSLARWWLSDAPHYLSKKTIRDALNILCAMAMDVYK